MATHSIAELTATGALKPTIPVAASQVTGLTAAVVGAVPTGTAVTALPAGTSTAGQVLTSDGNGGAKWTAAPTSSTSTPTTDADGNLVFSSGVTTDANGNLIF